jgi:DNA modification methylase
MERMDYTIHNSDCLEVMATMDENSVDAIVSDPPYGLSFMGKGWDHAVPGVEFWAEALRVAKPGAHLLAFGGTRLYHRLTCAIEDAGWEVRDCLMWIYGQGFPKSKDFAKDDAASRDAGFRVPLPEFVGTPFESGYGTALKPSWEPIIMARKPLAGTVAANVTEWGTGGINVDGCRVGTETTTTNGWKCGGEQVYGGGNGRCADGYKGGENQGRWPANLLIEEGTIDAEWTRFFYQPKASKRDRDEGLEGPERLCGMMEDDKPIETGSGRPSRDERKNTHPTVKPTDLMRYLCRLVTPPGGTILDPFTGSGSTGKAAMLEGFNFIGCELDATYCDTARRRIEHARTEAGLYATA